MDGAKAKAKGDTPPDTPPPPAPAIATPPHPLSLQSTMPPHNEKSKQFLNTLVKKLNEDIGLYYWKKYVAAAFWQHISMPINLTMTFLTALTAAQANTNDLIPQNIYASLSIASLIITTLNTFFRPHTQLIAANEVMQKWNSIGIEFETVYYSDIECDYNKTENLAKAIQKYLAVQQKVNEQRKSEGVAAINILIDTIHFLIFRSCAKRHKNWIPRERLIADKKEGQSVQDESLSETSSQIP